MRSMRLFVLLAFNALMLLETHGFTFTDEADRRALLEFKSHVSDDKRALLSSWNHSFPLCNWKGVRCGRKHKRVTGLELGGLQLGGVISPSIGNLSFLTTLNLSENSFGGTIPQEVGNLFRLKYLDMSKNFLGGGIPIDLYNCSRLFNLVLGSNNLGEGISSEIGSLTKLGHLDVYENNLRGKLPASLGNLTSLQRLLLPLNNLEGEIPSDVAKLTQVYSLSIYGNNFSGVFPPAFYNLSSLESLTLSFNQFSGRLRPDFGILLPNLVSCIMGRNYLTGAIPTTLSNISSLDRLEMFENLLTGSIPTFGKIPNLKTLNLRSNFLGNYSSSGYLDFLSSLTNCTQLKFLWIGQNRLGGDFPISITNLSTKLLSLGFQSNHFSGRIPHDIGNLVSLQTLLLHENMLIGPLPASLGKLLQLRELSLSSNRLSREIPAFIGNITPLETLDLANNNFEGNVPPSLGKCTNLLRLYIESNELNGTIPGEIMHIQGLIHLKMSDNSLNGSLPDDIGKLQNLVALSLGNNKLSGKLPQTLGKCLNLENLYLEGNSFDGVIPDIKGLVGVKEVDLANNNLSGNIPEYLAKFSKLKYLNLSFNNFEGNVPMEGIFQNTTIVSIYGNNELCGGIRGFQLKPCLPQAPPMKTKLSSRSKKVVIGVSAGISLLSLLVIASVSLIWFRKRKKNKQTNTPPPSSLEVFHEKISYGDLRNATNGFSSSNMVGLGSFGTVFKAIFPTEEKVVAVKVLNMQRRGAMKSFMAECESLKDIRHRNLVKLLTACASIDFQGNEFRALIYEFMPNGSLDKWLHPKEVEEIRRPSRTLTLLERLNIAIDVASVLDYLHVHSHEPIAHCDLKPSNVLLDDDLTAHVSDFGLARLLLKFDQGSFFNQLSSAGVRGTIGYAAPEYGIGGQPSIHGDVYSFGVLLLEMFTGKRPTNELFGGNFTLHKYTKSALPERVLEIADEWILHIGLRVGFPIAECLTLVFGVGLRCCEESPMNRLVTSEAVKELISIREKFFKTKRTPGR
ncbi:PREDICTED: probable LRR receptor-like serine/threonine-protein kinase At3g47570 [Camelina sativa]|uniref:Probable LRR receptor-like serine/threonine-protein kinase At3g47570 n=1 Tax=Camelina sativa TaxID=90675 RepID=A0ABM0YMT4_CAMSA|nr:PREDICTED: probable LRR receptor-like serine/threonine-protein kinase At3g47570 [Camelina sativa]